MEINQFLSHFERLQKVGKEYSVQCPAHDDGTNSLGITLGQGDRILLHCLAGCEPTDILSKIGLTLKDLFPTTSVPLDNGTAAASKQKFHITATYPYRSAIGELLYQVVRLEPKSFAQRRPDGNGGWIWNMDGAFRVLYRLPEVLAAKELGETLYVCEGEKDADALAALGLVATTNSGGADQWPESATAALSGCNVVILPDNDKPGRKHAEVIRKALIGKAKKVKILNLPGLPDKGDVSDWLEGGGTREALEGLVAEVSDNATADPESGDEEIPPARIVSGLSSKKILKALYRGQDGDAELFIDLQRYRFLFDHADGRWYEWRENYWEQDEIKKVVETTKEVIELYGKEMVRQAKLMRAAGEGGEEKNAARAQKRIVDLRKKIAALHRLGHKNDVLKLSAAGEGSLGISGNEWDSDPWLLGCRNGVIDLRTGILRDGKQMDFIKSASPTKWEGLDAPCPTWDNFLFDVFDGDIDLINYIARLLGYAITGLNSEHVFPIFCGEEGRNGKGTLLETIHKILGSQLSGPLQAEMLLDQGLSRSSSGPSSDIMALRGKRIVWGSEPTEEKPFNVARIKWLVGGDTMVGRSPYGTKEVSFSPSHTLFLLANHRPRANPNDPAFWYRVHLIPFTISFISNPQTANQRQRDSNMREKLAAESSGILGWLVRGSLDWQKKGIDPPKIVINATHDYQNENDGIGKFIEENCFVSPTVSVKSGNFQKAFFAWCEENGVRRTSGNKVLAYLQRNHAVRSERIGNPFYLIGIGLRAEFL